MSGGSLNYFCYQLHEHIGDFDDKELDNLVSDLADLFKAREWYLSSDTGKDDWTEARDAFKNKWFTKHGREQRIEKYLKDFEDEIRDAFGMKKKIVQPCAAVVRPVADAVPEMDPRKAFAERLAAEIDRLGISNRKFAGRAGLTEVSVCRYLKRERIPAADTVLKCAKALGVTCDYLLGLSDDPHKTGKQGWA